jgi:hypothetical protein
MKAAPLKGNLNAQILVILITKEYVKDYNVGADCWRSTEVLTFDGNTKLKSIVTYESIRQHLTVYIKHFSFGTVVQLCTAWHGTTDNVLLHVTQRGSKKS